MEHNSWKGEEDGRFISNIECGRANPSLCALVKIANILKCSVDYFISGEYTYKKDKDSDKTLDSQIMDRLKYCDSDKKIRNKMQRKSIANRLPLQK